MFFHHYENCLSSPNRCNLPNKVYYINVKDVETNEYVLMSVSESTLKKWEEVVGSSIQEWKGITLIKNKDGISIKENHE